jgi:hypothetical protein
MKSKLLLLLIIACAALAPSASFAANPAEEDTTPRNKKIYLEPQKTVLEQGKFSFLGAVTMGYDNNAHLNSDRDEAFFTQQFFRAAYMTTFDKRTQGRATYDLMNLLYPNESDLSLVRNTVNLDVDHAVNKDFIVTPGYTFDSVSYTHGGDESYIEHGVGIKLKQRLPYKWYHTLLYSAAWRDYFDMHTQVSATVESDKFRNDWRNTLEYEIGRYFEKDWVKVTFQFYNNNSNEQYLDFYDYNSYKVGPSWTHLFNDKLSGLLSGYWQYRAFSSRPVVLDPTVKEHDSTYVATAGLYYSLTRACSLGLSYTYRQNNSNEPTESYSGSLTSASVYYRF